MNGTHDGAAQLAQIEIRGLTREAFLARSAMAAGAMYGLGAISPYVRRAMAQEASGDVDVLNFALTLEYLEAAFYERALADLDLGSELSGIAQEFGDHEQAHVDALKGTIQDLGGTPVTAPQVAFPMKNEQDFLKLGVTFEDTGVYAYNGAAPAISSKDVLAAAGSIVQIEGRHAAVLRMLSKQPPAPDAFDKTLTKDQVLSAVKPFIKA